MQRAFNAICSASLGRFLRLPAATPMSLASRRLLNDLAFQSSIELGWLHWILRVCFWKGVLLHVAARERPINNFPSLPPGLLSYGMTLAWRLKPARPRCLAFDSNRSFCGHSEKALDLRNLYISLSEMQREDSGITSSHGIFSSSWPCCYDVCPGSQAVLAGQAKQLAFFS